MIKAVIVEDEKKSAAVLARHLERHCPDVEVRGVAGSVEQGLALIPEASPDLVFLDIELPDGTGFDLLQRLEKRSFDVIFTTAYIQYAIKAIRFSAMDYILKPIDAAELKEAVERLRARSGKAQTGDKLDALMANLSGGSRFGKLAVPESDGLSFVEVDSIVRCESDGNYTHIILRDGKKLLSAKTLGDYEEMLQDENFVRVHRSHLISLAHVQRYIRGEGGFVVMSDGAQVEVSRRKKAEFLERIGSH